MKAVNCVTTDKNVEVIANARKLGIDAVISIGGEGSQTIALELFHRGARQCASEPLRRKLEAEYLYALQLRFVKLGPSLPERPVTRLRTQKPGQLVSVVRTQAPAERVPQQVQRGVGERIGGLDLAGVRHAVGEGLQISATLGIECGHIGFRRSTEPEGEHKLIGL